MASEEEYLKPSELPPEEDVSDNFSSGLVDEEIRLEEERRLHMRAFDYWHSLKGEHAYPLFADLRPDQLAPFKANSLLLEFNAKGTVVRFIGEKLGLLIDAPIQIGSYLADFPGSAFVLALVEQFSSEGGRSKAAEFEFVEDTVECRGMLLPFSSDGKAPNFVMVVSSFRRYDRPAASRVTPEKLLHLTEDAQLTADNLGHMDGTSRLKLYGALAKALSLYEIASEDTEIYGEFLAEKGLKMQQRAPFTPVLKLVFGKDYDKTRLTEYAAALSCAVRAGITSDMLEEYLADMPGGIKGCVQEERAFRRASDGTPARSILLESEECLRHQSGVNLEELKLGQEFSLLLARRGDDGSVKILCEAETSNGALVAAIKKAAKASRG